MSDPLLLLVEDEPDLRETLCFALQRRGFRVEAAESGEQALEQARASGPDLVLLDLMLPGLGGLQVCRLLRADVATRDTAIVMLTARGEEADIVRGLEAGADDYIVKPFSPRVLAARVEAVLRRAAAARGQRQDERYQAGGFEVDLAAHRVRVDGVEVELTATEFRLLTLLVRRPGRVFTRQQIIENIHDGLAAVTDRSVDVQVVGLRRKLNEAQAGAGVAVETVRGVGYRLRP